MTSYEFKVGDIVTCIEGTRHVIEGQDYEVVRLDRDLEGVWVATTSNPYGCYCYNRRFKLKGQEPKVSYRLGDKIQLTVDTLYPKMPKGSVGVIDEVTNGYEVMATFANDTEAGGPRSRIYSQNEIEPYKETKQMTEFVTTETITKKTINTVIDGGTPNFAYMSVVPDGDTLYLVIGANYEDRVACHFSKKSLADLINVLQDIHEAM